MIYETEIIKKRNKMSEDIDINIDENEPSEALKDKLKNLPINPGVYQYFNAAGKIIYVGKAINLRNRVRSYFQLNRPVDAKTKALVKKIADLEIIVTDSEAEALILEDTLIKKHKPRYNIMLRDDKTYPYVRVTNEAYPRVFVTRKVIRDGSKYYGPFTEVRNLKQMLRTIRTIFQLRSCDLKLTEENVKTGKFKVCLDYHIKKCEGPCDNLISKAKYADNIKNAIQIINGKTIELEKYLENEMAKLSEDMRFEEAAIMRNRLITLRDYSNTQKMVSVEQIDRDVFGLARIDDLACTIVLKIRDGKLIGKRHFIITNAIDKIDEEIIETTIEKWYMETEFIPKEIFLPCPPEQEEFINDWLKRKKGKTVEIFVPKLGDKKKIVNMAAINAEFQLREYMIAMSKKEQTASRAVLSLQRDLRMSKPPVRIECFDNSHIQGSELVSSMVSFFDGKPKKSDYRKFKIRTVGQNNDFASMQEVVRRRYTRVIEEKTALPDLIIIDGGKGQLSSSVEILTELGIIDKVTIISLAKRLEEVFVPGNSEPIMLPRTSSSLKLIQHLRDEAHRFAITFHRSLRDKRTLQTELTEIEGIGEKTAQRLLIKFGSVEGIRKSTKEDLIAEIGTKLADRILEHFK